MKQEWKLNKSKTKNVVFASVIAFSFSFLFTLCTYNVSMENSLMISKSVGFYNGEIPLPGSVLMVANLLVIAPIKEEIAFRGIVYTRVEKNKRSDGYCSEFCFVWINAFRCRWSCAGNWCNANGISFWLHIL